MKKLNISWDNVHDDTGYLFSFAKCLCCALKNSKFSDFAEDIIATSGFAFRMWASSDPCPSATMIWDFSRQNEWIAGGGILTETVGRYWGQDEFEESRRKQAIQNIRRSIDNGIPAIAYDIDIPEWGLITGYDDDAEKLFYLAVNGKYSEMLYHELGKQQIGILNVITIENKKYDWYVIYLRKMLETACAHLNGSEWSGENRSGLSFYPEICGFLKERYNPERKSVIEYYLGTYGALKWYAYKIFEKYGFEELAALYKDTYDCWIGSFNLRNDVDSADAREKIIQLLSKAHDNEIKAVGLMKAVVIDDEAPPVEQDYTHIYKQTDMKRTLIKELCMKNSGFNDIDLSNTKYVNLNMKNSTFYNINLDNTSFCGSNMNSTGYICINMRNSIFLAVNLTNSVFLENCSFENAEIINCNIKGLKINGVEIDKLIEKELSKQ